MGARILDSGIQQSSRRQTNQSPRLVDITGSVPAANCEDAVFVQGLQKGAPSFQSVEPILAQAERACAGSREGVDHAHLHQIEFIVGGCKPASRVIHVQLQIGQGRQIGEILITRIARMQIDDDGINFNAGYLSYSEEMSRQSILTAAKTDYRGLMNVGKTICQTDDFVLQKIDGVPCAVVVKQVGGVI